MFRSLIFIVLLTVVNACDTPPPACEGTPDFLDNKNILASEGQTLLKDKLKEEKPEDYRYIFETFEEEGDKTYMITNFRKDGVCFDVKILVDKWDKLGGMRRVNGKSYPKELFNLKWEIIRIDGIEEIIYRDMDTIVD